MAAPEFIAMSADGTFATTGLHWEGFTSILWGALSAVGYTTPPFYKGVEYEELGVPRCRVQVTVLPHPDHPEWASLSTELLCHCAMEAVESVALQVLNAFCSHHPQHMMASPLGLLPAVDPNDPAWLARLANIATLLDTVRPFDTVQTLSRCLGTLYNLQVLRRAITDDLSYRLAVATGHVLSMTATHGEQYNGLAQAQYANIRLQGQVVQMQVERGNHLQQILQLRDGQQELQVRVADLEAERLVHLQHIDELQEQVENMEEHADAMDGVVGMLQQIHAPQAVGQGEQQEVQVEPEEVQGMSSLDEASQAAPPPPAAPGSPAASDGSVGN